MKKQYYIFLMVVFFAACQQKNTDDSNRNEVKELNIQVCKIYSSDFVLLDPNDKGLLIQEFRFNRQGYVNELIRYGIDGEILGKFDIYGENTPFPMPGKPEYVDTALVVVNIDSIGGIIGSEVKIYNANGLLTEVRFYEGESTLVKKNTYKYNSKGIIQEDIYWDVELNKPKQIIRYEFEYFID